MSDESNADAPSVKTSEAALRAQDKRPHNCTSSRTRFGDTKLTFAMTAYEHREYGKDVDVIWIFDEGGDR